MIAAYVANQQQQLRTSPHAFGSATQQPQIRVERIDSEWFSRERSASTFTTFFQSAWKHYARFDRQPVLPVLSRCCFSGVWQYLRSFGLESTLIAQEYVSCQASVTPGATQRCKIPVESHDDLDLFVNSVRVLYLNQRKFAVNDKFSMVADDGSCGRLFVFDPEFYKDHFGRKEASPVDLVTSDCIRCDHRASGLGPVSRIRLNLRVVLVFFVSSGL